MLRKWMILLIPVIALAFGCAWAEENSDPEIYVHNDYSFIVENNAATIVGYSGSASSLTVADTLQDSSGTSYIVREIADGAFEDNTTLETLYLYSCVRSVGANAFKDCTSLSYVSIGSPIWNTAKNLYLGESAFEGCTALSYVDIGGGILDIGDRCFADCTALSYVSPGYQLNSIGSESFLNCTSLQDLHMLYGTRLKTIGSRAFANSGIRSMILPICTESVYTDAFEGCTSLMSVLLHTGTALEGSYTFTDSANINIITVSGSPAHTFAEANGIPCTLYNITGDGFVYTIADGEAQIMVYVGNESNVTIPAELDGCPVTSIAESAFIGNEYLGSVYMPDTIVSIGKKAFYNSWVMDVKMSAGLQAIGESAFAGCYFEGSIVIPEGVTSLGAGAFNTDTEIICYAGEDIYNQMIEEGYTEVQRIFTSEAYPDFTFAQKDSVPGMCIITGYSGSAASLTIPGFVDGLQVDMIAAGAFADNTTLESVNIKYGATYIDLRAFENCTALRSISMQSVGAIGGRAFAGCTSLTDVQLSEEMQYLGWQAFSGCTALESITIPSAASEFEVGGSCFENCTSLAEVNFIDMSCRNWSIHDSAFAGCTSLERLNFDRTSTLQHIGSKAFEGCDRLTYLFMPKSTGGFNEDTFDGCENVVLMVEYNSYARICAEEYGIAYCLVDGATEDGYIFFAYEDSQTVEIRGYEGEIGEDRRLEIPSEINGYKVTIIGDYAFSEMGGLDTVVIPEGVEALGFRAFYDCYELKEIELPESLRSIGDGCFYNCNFARVNLPDGVTFIGKGAFESCSLMISASLPSGITSLNAYTFANTHVWEISLPAGIKSIDEGAFYSNTSIYKINLPEGLQSIGQYAFYRNRRLKALLIPESVEFIHPEAFASSTNLTLLVYPDSYGHAYAVQNEVPYVLVGDLTPVSEIILSAYQVNAKQGDCFEILNQINEDAPISILHHTSDNPAVATVDGDGMIRVVGNGSATIRVEAMDGSGTYAECEITAADYNELTLPAGAQDIKAEAFAGNTALEAVILESELGLTVEDYAFAGCTGLKRVVFSGYNNIAETAFDGCDNATMFYQGEDQIMGSNSFVILVDPTHGIPQE